jgi:SpoVK/Ycf46/Vps4 family AAA+-type ATPase
LLGVQGCGKSTVAKAMSRFWGIPLLRFHFGGIFSQTDSPDSALQHAFHVAESMSPCIFWIDEIEKGLEHAEGVMARLLGTLLTWLQEKEKPVFFVATANQIEHLPPELLRQGRLDEVFFLDLPDQQARQDILSLHLQARGRQPKEFPIEQIAAHCEHFSGAELEQIVVSGMYKAFAQKTSLNGEQLWAAVHETKPLYALYEEQIKAFRSWAKQRTRAAAHKRELLELFTPNSNPEGFTNVMPRTTNEASCFKVEQNG